MPRPPHNTWVQGNSAGSYSSPVDKFLIHTTEGGSIAGAVAAYRANNSWPHLTVDARVGQTPTICGHLDLNVAARSLRNMAGGVQTNTDGVIQIEVVGTATNPAGIDWAWIGEHVVGPICRTMGIPVHSTVSWVPYPASYGLRAAQRLSGAAWTAYQGVLGHQHAPENDHGDPGAIPILVVLDAAKFGGGSVPKEDTLSAAEVEAIKAHVTAEANRVIAQVHDSRPFFAQDYERGDDVVWVVYKGDGTKRWVPQPGDTPESQEFPGEALALDRVQSDGFWPNGYPRAWGRSKAHLDLYETVGPVPPGWE